MRKTPPTPDMDWELMWWLEDFFAIGRGYIRKDPWWLDDPNQQYFSYVCCGTEIEGYLIFQRGIGLVQEGWRSTLSSARGVAAKLVWARINGEEYGTHPGPDYPGYRQTAVTVQTWGKLKSRAKKQELKRSLGSSGAGRKK